MGGASCDDPGDSLVRIRAVPDPATSGHLVLPLVQPPAGYLAASKLATKLLLTGRVAWGGWAFGENDPCLPGIGLGSPAEFFPALHSF